MYLTTPPPPRQKIDFFPSSLPPPHLTILGFNFFVWYCVQLTRFVAILLNWGRGEQAAQAVPPPNSPILLR